jgi:hydroxymethylpyrimidine/phosphomethylpyrimidine kinase
MQADLKTFSSLGVHGLTAVTCVVAETPRVVADIHAVPHPVLQEQVRLLLASYSVAAIKTGMLFSAAHVVAVAELLEQARLPLVVDPVMVASSGQALLDDGAISIYLNRLLPICTVMTPNLPEAQALLGCKDLTPESATRQLADRFETSVFLTGGHHARHGKSVDLLYCDGELHAFEGDWIETPSSHGTGCTLSAALTAGLAKGLSLPEAARAAKDFVTGALRNALHWPAKDGQEDLIALNQCPPQAGP